MSTETLTKSKEEVDSLIAQADGVLDEISNTLSTVEVNIPKTSPTIIQAISAIFGANYIKSDGSAVITYKMFNQVNTLLRQAGKLKVKEYV